MSYKIKLASHRNIEHEELQEINLGSANARIVKGIVAF